MNKNGVKVSWDDEIPKKYVKVIQNSMVPVTTNQISRWKTLQKIMALENLR
jgi:hypothetical protein